MARTSDGTYTRVSNSFTVPVTGTAISSTHADAFWDELDTEMTDSLSRTGKGGMSADLDMNNNDITEVKTVDFKGSTSGTTTVLATAIAGTTTLTLPAATDTVVGKATTDTLTNKSVSLTTNTLTGSVSEFNTALQAADFLTTAAVVTEVQGGTGAATYTQGDILYASAANTLSKLAAGTNGHFLKTQGAGANPTWTAIPGGGDMLAANNLSDVASAATAFANIKQAGSTTATGVYELAIQSEMEAGTDAARVPSVSVMHFHPGSAKAWGQWDAAGTLGTVSYGITSITDTGAGAQTANLSVTLSGATSAAPIASAGTVAGPAVMRVTNTTTTVDLTNRKVDDAQNLDAHPFKISVHGDL